MREPEVRRVIVDNESLRRRVTALEREKERLALDLAYARRCWHDADNSLQRMGGELAILLAVVEAAKATLEENLDLADGERCTLRALRDAARACDPQWWHTVYCDISGQTLAIDCHRCAAIAKAPRP